MESDPIPLTELLRQLMAGKKTVQQAISQFLEAMKPEGMKMIYEKLIRARPAAEVYYKRFSEEFSIQACAHYKVELSEEKLLAFYHEALAGFCKRMKDTQRGKTRLLRYFNKHRQKQGNKLARVTENEYLAALLWTPRPKDAFLIVLFDVLGLEPAAVKEKFQDIMPGARANSPSPLADIQKRLKAKGEAPKAPHGMLQLSSAEQQLPKARKRTMELAARYHTLLRETKK